MTAPTENPLEWLLLLVGGAVLVVYGCAAVGLVVAGAWTLLDWLIFGVIL